MLTVNLIHLEHNVVRHTSLGQKDVTLCVDIYVYTFISISISIYIYIHIHIYIYAYRCLRKRIPEGGLGLRRRIPEGG